MPDQLTPARLRELIAAATPGPWFRYESHFYKERDRLLGTIQGPRLIENATLFLELVNNASALADALGAKELLEWLGKAIIDGWTVEWNPHQGLFEVLNDEGRYVAGSDVWIDALRAAKEAAQST